MPFPMSPSPPARAAGIAFMAALSVLMAFGPMSTDMYLPALPRMAEVLGSTPARLQLTVSSFLVGFGLGQLIWGPLGDRFGRKVPVVGGICLYLVATVGCAVGTSLAEVVVWRVLQALGACAGPVLARAMVRDVYGREQGARALSTLMLVMSVAPLIAPLLGGQMLLWFDWRAIFWLQAGFGALALLSVTRLKDTLPVASRATLHPHHVLHAYLDMLTSRRFLLPALTGGFFYVGVFSYVAGTPFAYVVYHHVAPELYGLLFAIGICGMTAMNVVNRAMVPRYGSERMQQIGSIVALLSGAATALTASTDWGGLPGLVAPLLVYIAMLGLISANALSGAMAAFPQRAGAASALAGCLQFCFGAFGSAIVAWLADGTPGPMGWVIAVSGVLTCVSTLLLRPRGPVPAEPAARATETVRAAEESGRAAPAP